MRACIATWASEGRCVLIASHLLAELALVVDRVVIIDRGTIAYEGAVGATAPGPSVRVCCADPDVLAALVRGRGGAAVWAGSSDLYVTGLTVDEVGRLAATAGGGLSR